MIDAYRGRETGEAEPPARVGNEIGAPLYGEIGRGSCFQIYRCKRNAAIMRRGQRSREYLPLMCLGSSNPCSGCLRERRSISEICFALFSLLSKSFILCSRRRKYYAIGSSHSIMSNFHERYCIKFKLYDFVLKDSEIKQSA